ncbi:rod shape-determining protein MreD [Anaerobacillus sp. CMMVII]|uniref:rod shape-determining protein MreD n=1 Tax=Anaerobacillus sp. CMMVII TaxID=2755588 RepID=UPI0021B70D27|nr:rod shape-determining protein MreD [Anaerobacillus sp. CMMVII]MCT8137519.1 rod shape-determining protein MreD [Anaerobacillus sp. CMMVII]
MLRFLLPSIIFILFIIEGTVMQVIAPDRFGSEFIIIPRFAFVVVIVIAIFLGRTTGTIYALFLGLFQDIIYTHVLGVYIFSMALITYLLGFSYKIFQKNLSLLFITTIVGTILLEYLVYGIYSMVNITNLLHENFFYERLLPSLLVNSVFLIIFAYPLRKLLVFLQNKDDIEEKINKRKKDFRWQR